MDTKIRSSKTDTIRTAQLSYRSLNEPSGGTAYVFGIFKKRNAKSTLHRNCSPAARDEHSVPDRDRCAVSENVTGNGQYGSVNIPVFVDKFLNQIHFAGVSMTNITHLSGQFMLFSIFAAGVGVCQGIIDGSTLGELVPYYIVSLFGLYLYFSISSLVDAKGKKNMVRTNLIDYLENHLIKHLLLLKEEEMQPYILKDAKEDETGNSLPRESTVQTAIADGEQDEQDELEELLREFLA